MKAKSSKGGALKKLTKVLQTNLPQNKARTKFIASFVYAVIGACTVNLTKIVNHFDSLAKKDSQYKQAQRFFRFFKYSKQQFVLFIVKLLKLKKITLTMDRTNWDFGKKPINILMLAIVYKGIAFPIFWKILTKKGSSHSKERIEFLEEFLEIFDKENIENLLADREFIGHDWLKWLVEKEIPFVIRLKENFIVDNRKLKDFFRNLAEKENRYFIKKKKVLGVSLYLAGTRIKDGYTLVASSDYPDNALNTYLKRWEIETLFGCLKTRGFNFEDTHLTFPKRIDKMVFLLSIAFAWAHVVGQWLHKFNPILIKKHGRQFRSLFRYGLDYLQELIFNIETRFKEFLQAVSLLKFDYS